MAADPLWINASSGSPAYSANELRQAMALGLQYGGRNLGARQGVRPGGNQLQVSLAGSTITVQPGVACVDPALNTPQGPYWVAIPAAETHTLTAADATNPRKDIVTLRVYDHDEDASGLRLARTEYTAGTPNPSPAEPSVPAGAIRLATIDVPASPGAAVVTNNALSAVAAGGILPVASATVRDALTSPYASLAVWRTDTTPDRLEVYDGTRWLPINPYGLLPVADGTARDAITGLYEGLAVWRQDIDVINVYDGSGWRYFARPTRATVSTSQTTTSTSYTDLTTPGPAVTIETGDRAEVTIACTMSNSGGNHAYASFAVSGATTQAATDDVGILVADANVDRRYATVEVIGLTPGNNTFTMKYKVGASTGTFVDRRIHAKPI
jgi:hypothetical protein